MDERQEMFEKIILHLMSNNINVDEVKDGIYIVLSAYEVQKRCTEIAAPKEDRNRFLINRFLVAKTVKGCTERTLEFYGKQLQYTLGRIGKTVDDITADDIRLYIAVRTKKDGITKVTADNELRILRTFYTYLQSEEIVLNNPMLKIERIKAVRTKKEALTEMEVERIRETAMLRGEREAAVIEILLSTGIRVSELVGIRLKEIEKERILVHGKGQKDRYVYLNAKAKMAIERYLLQRRDRNPYLFPGGMFGMINKTTLSKNDMINWWKNPENIDGDRHIDKGSIEALTRRIAKRAGVEKANPHKFRRTCATMALRRGMPVEQVSKMLGHESIQTTQIYLDLAEEDLVQAHKKYVV